MRSPPLASAPSKATPSGSVQYVPSSGPRAVNCPASPDSWPSSARIQAQAVSASRGSATSLARGDLVQLLVKLGIDLRAVDAPRVGRLDPVLDQRLGALAHVGDELGARLDDRHVRGLERFEADLVGGVPRPPRGAREGFRGDGPERGARSPA